MIKKRTMAYLSIVLLVILISFFLISTREGDTMGDLELSTGGQGSYLLQNKAIVLDVLSDCALVVEIIPKAGDVIGYRPEIQENREEEYPYSVFIGETVKVLYDDDYNDVITLISSSVDVGSTVLISRAGNSKIDFSEYPEGMLILHSVGLCIFDDDGVNITSSAFK